MTASSAEPAALELDRTIWVTALSGGIEHAVAQVDLAAGTRDPDGFAAVCGVRFWAAPMITEPGSQCYRCAHYLRTRATLRSAEERMAGLPKHRREWIIRRFLAVAMAKVPITSQRCPDSTSTGEATGRHARRDCDASSSRLAVPSRSTIGRHALDGDRW